MVEISFHRSNIIRQSTEIECYSEKLRGARFLFVDDDYVNFLFFSELLSDTGIIFYRAYTITKTLQVLQKEKDISLVAVSASITRQTPYDIIHLIKSEFPSMPVITIIGEKNPVIEHACQEAGSDLFLSRYVDKHNLIEALAEIVKCTYP